jgi:hypothetical protein
VITGRWGSLVLIISVCTIGGVVLATILGAIGWKAWTYLIGAPVLLGIAFGLVGLDPNGEARNRKIVLWMGIVVAFVLLSLLAAISYALLNSTDL